MWFLIPPGPAAAQTPAPAPAHLQGEVLEHGSGRPLVGATLRAGDQRATTDARGRFVLTLPPGTTAIQIEAADHVDQAFTEVLHAGVVHTVRYRLERISWSEELIVYGTSRQELSRERYTADELRRVPGTFGDPIRALQSLPSVARPTSPLDGALVARGAEGANTGTYIDEIQVPFLFHFLVGRSVINPALLDDVEFYPGAVPPQFGDVTQAVVNARTASGPAEAGLHGRFHVDLLDAGGSLAAELGRGWTLRTGGRIGWVTGVISGGSWALRRLQGLGDRAIRPPSLALPYEDGLVRLEHTTDRDWIAVTALGARDGIRLIPEWTDQDGDGIADPPPFDPTAPFDPNELLTDRFFRIALRWDHTTDARRLSTWVAAGRHQHQSLIPGFGPLGEGAEYARGQAGWYRLRHDGVHALAEALELRLGLDALIEPASMEALLGVESLDDLVRTEDVHTWGSPYGDLVWRDGPLRLSSGIRVSHHTLRSSTFVAPEPRLSARLALSEAWHATLFVGALAQAPGLQQTAEAFGQPPAGLTRSSQLSAGLEGRWPSGLGLDVALYTTQMHDLLYEDQRVVIARAPQDANTSQTPSTWILPFYRPVDGRAHGLELRLRARPQGDWFGWISLTAARSLRFDANGRFPSSYDRPLSLVFVGSRALPGGWSISGRGQLAHGLPYTPLSGAFDAVSDLWFPQQGERNSDRFPVFRQLDLRIDHTWSAPRARWTLYLDVYNALNQRNPVVASYNWGYTEVEIGAWIPILPTLGLEASY